jgi:hypothetical protein
LALPVHIDVGAAQISNGAKRHGAAINNRGAGYRTSLERPFCNGAGQGFSVELEFHGDRLRHAVTVSGRKLTHPLAGNTRLSERGGGHQRHNQEQ